MANSRTVELQIQLEGAKSITDLEQVLKDINKELKQVDTNSEAFAELSKQVKKADSSLKDVKEDLKSISSEKQLDSVAKIGGSLAAGLSVATIASSHFGKQTQESVQKAIQTATELSVVVGSIKPIMEGLSSSNRKAFAAFVTGFKESALGATLFGNATRAALTATGIGLFIVALGLIVTYWDDIKGAITGAESEQEKYFRTQQEGIEKSKVLVDGYNKSLEFQNQLLKIQGEQEDQIFSNKRAALLAQISIQEKQQELSKEQLVGLVKELKMRREINESVGFNKDNGLGDLIDKITSLKKQFDDASKASVDLKNSLALLDAEENKFNDNAEEESKKRAEEQRKRNEKQRQDELKARKEAAEKERAAFKKSSDDLHKEFNYRKQADFETDKLFSKKTEDLEVNTFDNIKISYEELYDARATILASQERLEKESAKNRLDAQLDYYNQLGELDEDQLSVYRDLQEQKYLATVEQLNKIQPVLQLASQGINEIGAAITTTLATNIDSLSTEIDFVTSRFQESVAIRESLEAQLGDAQGERRDALLQGIDDEAKKQKQLADKKKQLQNEEIKQKNKLNEVNWKLALLNGIVNTAGAVINALNGPYPLSLVFAALAGILGGVEIATIASNKPEKIPTFAKGGYTEAIGNTDSTGYRVAGVVHENEYVIPEHVLKTNIGSQMAEALEAMRLGRPQFADGGFTSPSISERTFNGLSGDSLLAAVQSARIQVAVTDINEGQARVEVLESKGTL